MLSFICGLAQLGGGADVAAQAMAASLPRFRCACKPYHAPNNAHLVNRAVIGAIGAIGVIVGKHAPRLGKFHNMRAAIAADDWRLAAAEALDSKWARQLPARTAEIAGLLRG